ncbi:MAG: acyl-[acyl-carrier-protein]--UDP-N-acetylglucosamine O-acyltransferase [Candidatus Nephrothrix sp. EaCA]|nr:MAG: acyl-[acyl-carrier-protein]--UDP-N-acetylglucosamine O-acyltransferase [Candidatus Nephrothrix sp. EaCA]
MTKIHPLALVHPDAKIGSRVEIEAFASVKGDVVIGDGSYIASHAVIWDGARLGKNVKIFPGASIAAVPQDLKFAGEKTETLIGDNTVIRECVTVSRGTADKMKTKIGSDCLLMAYVHIAHDCLIGNHCIFSNAVQLAGHVHIDDWAILGGTSAVHQFVKIGAHVMVAGGSLVRKDVPPYCKAGREPLSYVGVNTVGLQRRGFSPEKIGEIQEVYRTLFYRGNNNSKALNEVEQMVPPSAERDYILEFIRTSERGIMKGVGKASEEVSE